jgi:hypothetical protein
MPVTKRVSPGETFSTTVHLTDKEEEKPVVDVRIMNTYSFVKVSIHWQYSLALCGSGPNAVTTVDRRWPTIHSRLLQYDTKCQQDTLSLFFHFPPFPTLTARSVQLTEPMTLCASSSLPLLAYPLQKCLIIRYHLECAHWHR